MTAVMLKQIATATTVANKSQVLLPRSNARRKQRTYLQNASADRIRVHEQKSIFRMSLCRPMAPALPLRRTETSVRRRFLSSPRTSHSSPVRVYVGCRIQSTIAGREIRRRGFGASPPPEKPNGSGPFGSETAKISASDEDSSRCIHPFRLSATRQDRNPPQPPRRGCVDRREIGRSIIRKKTERGSSEFYADAIGGETESQNHDRRCRPVLGRGFESPFSVCCFSQISSSRSSVCVVCRSVSSSAVLSKPR